MLYDVMIMKLGTLAGLGTFLATTAALELGRGNATTALLLFVVATSALVAREALKKTRD